VVIKVSRVFGKTFYHDDEFKTRKEVQEKQENNPCQKDMMMIFASKYSYNISIPEIS
jgi:hypothetical protein